MQVVVIGGVAAGMSAAAKLRRLRPDAQITVYEKGTEVSYGACGLPYYISGENPDLNRMRIRTAADFTRQGITVRLQHEAVALDPAARVVRVRDRVSGRESAVPYDGLVIATGASPVVPPVPGIHLRNVLTLKTLADGELLRRALLDPEAAEVAIVGSGFIGLEMAEACVRLGKRVRIIEMAPRVLPAYEPEISERLVDALNRHGVQVHLGERLTGLQGEGAGHDPQSDRPDREAWAGEGPAAAAGSGRVRMLVTDAGAYRADLVLLAMGVRPNTAFLREVPGLRFLSNGALVVNRRMETGLPGVYAGGDCTAVPHRLLGSPVYLPLGTNANKQGRIIGENLAGGRLAFPGALGTSMLRVLDLEAGKTGLSTAEAEAAGIPVGSTVVEAQDHAPYYPDPAPLRIKLVYHRQNRRILGASLVGRRGAALRTDVLAAMIAGGMTLEEARFLDLGYAPPFAQVWDAVHVAAWAAGR